MTDRDKLLEQRARLVKQIEDLQAKGPDGRSAAALRFHAEDLQTLAKKIVSIDRKLGRA